MVNYCIDCKKIINPPSKRCIICFHRNRTANAKSRNPKLNPVERLNKKCQNCKKNIATIISCTKLLCKGCKDVELQNLKGGISKNG